MQTRSRPPEFEDYLQHLRATHADLATEFAGFTGIEQVLQWMSRRQLTGRDVDIVGQDEFHYDFLVRLDGEGRWLGFGVN
jgi:hypothetical protein